MANIDDIYKYLMRLDRKVNKMDKLLTQIAKNLHLVPITEEEEKKFQIMQRKNAEISKKVYDQLEDMKPVEVETGPLNISEGSFNGFRDVYSDVIGDEYLG